MAKVDVDSQHYFAQIRDELEGKGLLLVSISADGRPNAMAIGWGAVGWIWGKPIFMVLVRPSRYSAVLLDQTSDFTINLMPAEMADVILFCGSVSGRQHDKFAKSGLNPVPAQKVKAPVIEQALLQYECRVVQKTDVAPETFDRAIVDEHYRKGDFHHLYFGEILAVHAEESLVPFQGKTGEGL
jgi:flavin reductase (DIM6/NTAB) family NADH-FMN oxidoreductase RutF